jgi:hypothetical protein
VPGVRWGIAWSICLRTGSRDAAAPSFFGTYFELCTSLFRQALDVYGGLWRWLG